MRVKVAVLAVALSIGVFSQDSPTYDQTRDWIVSKLNTEAGRTHPNPSQGHETTTYDQVSVDKCKLQYAESLYDSLLDNTMIDVVSIPLDKVSSVSVQHLQFQNIIDDYEVRISTPFKVITVKRTTKGGVANGVQDQDVLNVDRRFIVFGRSKATNEDLANRMQKALTHIVALCATNQTKEPF